MTGRCETETIKVSVADAPPIFLHVDRWRHAAPTFWVSTGGKYRDKAMGNLLEELMTEINKALA